MRLQQISLLLNLDHVGGNLKRMGDPTHLFIVQEEDVDGFYSGSGISWTLSLQDAKNVVALKA